MLSGVSLSFGDVFRTGAWGSCGITCESQRNPDPDPRVPLHLEGLRWHVMNDSAEPEIFMHELQLYVSLSLLKNHNSLCQRGHFFLTI